jgi:predicted dehydrogenase
MSLGVGFLAVSHPHCSGRANAVLALESVHLAGAFDSDESVCQKFTETYGAEKYRSAADLLADENVHCVIIEGTNLQNSELAIACAKAKKPMLLEKPGANNLENMLKVMHEVESSGITAQVGYHLRYSPSIEKAREILSGGLLGRITTARFHAAVMAPWLTDFWFCDPNDRGGLVFNDFCHMLDLLCLLLGNVTSAQGVIKKLDGVPEHPFEDSAAFVFEFGDVVCAGDVCGWEANDWIETWDIQLFGTEGTLQIGIHPPSLKLFLNTPSGTYAKGWNEWSDLSFDGEMNYHREINDFATSLLLRKPSMGARITDAVNVLSWIDRLYDSAKGSEG